MGIKINYHTTVSGIKTGPVQKAADCFMRDLKKVFLHTDEPGAEIRLVEGRQEAEGYLIQVRNGHLEIQASDDLGFIYGLYEISRSVLGVNEFWFWNDQEFVPKKEARLPEDFCLRSVPYRVRYRGWFVNDEVLLHAWTVDREKEKAWEMVFEALLRCGGNMVIPGTDQNSKLYADMAAGMGLWITHHHAEPLGAEMFARAYPGLQASYDLYPEKFHALWQEALERQKAQKTIWNLGFRGQGDRPFWEDDERYRTDAARGKLMGELIRKQYDMVKAMDAEAVCSTNLYGETMELYQKGCLALPEDVIKIWADNGFGKMVSRRQWNDNPRICSLPEKKEDANGIYYHVSFYDLQAANHITMLPNSPEFVKWELTEVLDRGGDDFWIINCSNVKPHVYYLDFIARMWKNGEVDVEEHRQSYVAKYYLCPENGQNRLIAERLKEYHQYAVSYGKHEDEHAGEQFTNHVVRVLVNQYMRNREKRSEELLWAVTAEDLKGQILWYKNICEGADYPEYVRKCMETGVQLSGRGRELFRDSILLQARIHCHCFQGALYACESMLAGLEEDDRMAFYKAGKARKEYLAADSAMREREHGKWHGFYQNECLTDIKQTAWVLEGFMSYLRALGDGPHYYHWQREYLYSEKDSRVMLLLNTENHLRDQEIFALMEEKMGD